MLKKMFDGDLNVPLKGCRLKETVCVYFFKNNLPLIIGFLTLFRMSFFGHLPKKCYAYPIMMKLGTVILYLKKIQQIYKSPDTPPEFC